MLFNSLPFLFGFLPLTWFAFVVLGRVSHRAAALCLVAASMMFYGWWDREFLGLLLFSITLNYGVARLITSATGVRTRKLLLVFGVGTDLALLGYFKYANFFARAVDAAMGVSLFVPDIVLPLGISFFTFTQIAFLVDTYQGKAKEYALVRYALFVTYFPHLIAGPILHHKQMMPQFAEAKIYSPNWTNIAVGMTLLAIGLAKKVLIADTFAQIASPIFSAAKSGGQLTMVAAWAGAVAYTLQLYFDFSGYSDMAIGISRIFNVKLPLNFNSPYKATSIIEFWRRWHMTLSAFLRDYLYIPLGGNRKGAARRHVNLMTTMLLGGLWHGAGWTFVVWGGLHGIYLMINHGFQNLCARNRWSLTRLGFVGTLGTTGLTFGAVVVAWVFFRADTFAAAAAMLSAMAGAHGFLQHPVFGPVIAESGMSNMQIMAVLLAGLGIVWLLPNSQQLLREWDPAPESVPAPASFASRIVWRPGAFLWWAPLSLVLTAAVVVISARRATEFLYFQF